jgi:hypothetical protein
MGTDQQRAASRGQGAAWPAAHADGREPVSKSTRVDIAGREPGLQQQLGLRAAGAGLLAAAGAIHLDLYLTGYRTIPTIGWLFLLQVTATFVLAVAVLVSGGRMVAAAGAGLAVATLGGYIASVWAGLFAFTEVRTTAGIAAGIIETAAFAALAAVAPAAERRPAGPILVAENPSGWSHDRGRRQAASASKSSRRHIHPTSCRLVPHTDLPVLYA